MHNPHMGGATPDPQSRFSPIAISDPTTNLSKIENLGVKLNAK